MQNRPMTIWEEYGIPIEEYAKAFNKVLDDAWKRLTTKKTYFIKVDDERSIVRIANIDTSE